MPTKSKRGNTKRSKAPPPTEREPIDLRKLPRPGTKARLKLCAESMRHPVPIRFPDGTVEEMVIMTGQPRQHKKRVKKPLHPRDQAWLDDYIATYHPHRAKNNDHARKIAKK